MDAVVSYVGRAVDQMTGIVTALDDDLANRKPALPGANSPYAILRHCLGVMEFWGGEVVARREVIRDRPAEFSELGPIPKDELLRKLEAVVDEARAVLARLTARQLLEARRIQGFDVTGLAAIFDSVPHFRGHTQEIVHMTRLQLGDAYQFAWTPTTPEQGAPA